MESKSVANYPINPKRRTPFLGQLAFHNPFFNPVRRCHFSVHLLATDPNRSSQVIVQPEEDTIRATS